MLVLQVEKYSAAVVQQPFFLHKKGITHQGISPENISLDEENRVYWRADFLLEMRTATEMEPQLLPDTAHRSNTQPERRGGWTDLYLDRSGDLPGIDRC